VTTRRRFFEDYVGLAIIVGGFIFTLAGTIASLIFAREYCWIFLLTCLVCVLVSGYIAYDKHRSEAQAKTVHEIERTRLLSEQQAMALRLQEADRKLNEVPLDLLMQVRQIVISASLTDLARVLIDAASLVARQRQLMIGLDGKVLSLQMFSRQGDRLFVLVKMSAAALTHLQLRDPFLLLKKAANGVEDSIAMLAVHQLPDMKKEVAYFVVNAPIPSELEPMVDMATGGDVKGIKGYRIEPACDISRYENLDLSSVEEIVRLLTEDATRRAAGGTL
jgi:hypothetical protein